MQKKAIFKLSLIFDQKKIQKPVLAGKKAHFYDLEACFSRTPPWVKKNRSLV
jgi:hypothetical protein